MEYINCENFIYSNSPTVIAVGNFDGFHRGHRALIEKINDLKSDIGGKSLVFSFNPRPVEVFKNIRVKSILSLEERMEIAENLGVDVLMEYPFSLAFSLMSGEEFLRSVLKESLGCTHLVVGADFAFGKDRAWDTAGISVCAAALGISFTALPHELSPVDGVKISSTDIRRHIANGRIEEANALLGYNYYLLGRVCRVDGNYIHILADEGKLLPPDGEYTCEVRSDIAGLGGICSTEIEADRLKINGDFSSAVGQKVRLIFNA